MATRMFKKLVPKPKSSTTKLDNGAVLSSSLSTRNATPLSSNTISHTPLLKQTQTSTSPSLSPSTPTSIQQASTPVTTSPNSTPTNPSKNITITINPRWQALISRLRTRRTLKFEQTKASKEKKKQKQNQTPGQKYGGRYSGIYGEEWTWEGLYAVVEREEDRVAVHLRERAEFEYEFESVIRWREDFWI